MTEQYYSRGAELGRQVSRAIGRQVVVILAAYFLLSSLATWAQRACEWHYYQRHVDSLHELLKSVPGPGDSSPGESCTGPWCPETTTPNSDRYRRQPSPAQPDSLHFYSIKDSSLPMRVYLAAAFQRQQEMRQYADQLRAEGIEVVSAWHDLDSPSSDGFHGIADERLAWLAMLDIQQLSGANALVTFSDAERYTPAKDDGRKHVDAGIALALGKRLLMIGPNENCYHALPDVEHFPAWPDCFARILELRSTDAMTTRQAAAEAGTTVKQITMWIRDGSLPAAKNRGHYVIARNDLDRRKAQMLRDRADG